MADTKVAFGTSTLITMTLASLANGTARESLAVDNASNKFLDALCQVQIRLVNGAPANDQRAYIYAYGSEDGTIFTDNATGLDATIAIRAVPNLRLVGSIYTPDSGGLTYVSNPFRISPAFGGLMPRKWGLIILNWTGLAFTATEGDHKKSYTGIYTTTV